MHQTYLLYTTESMLLGIKMSARFNGIMIFLLLFCRKLNYALDFPTYQILQQIVYSGK